MGSESTKNAQKGQILLLVVLASVIALTVGLAAVSRSITSTRISTEESNSQKALAAAEAGVEEQINRALTGNIADGEEALINQLGNNSGFISEAEPVEPAAGEDFEVNKGNIILQDEGVDVWLSNQEFDESTRTSPELTIYWNGNGDCTSNAANAEAAIEVAVLHGDRDDPSMSRYAYDGCTRGNNFLIPESIPGNYLAQFDTDYNRKFTINITDGYIARVIPLYGSTKIAVSQDVDLPVQGYNIESTGEAGTTKRKLQVYQEFPKLPIEFFPYNLFLP